MTKFMSIGEDRQFLTHRKFLEQQPLATATSGKIWRVELRWLLRVVDSVVPLKEMQPCLGESFIGILFVHRLLNS